MNRNFIWVIPNKLGIEVSFRRMGFDVCYVWTEKQGWHTEAPVELVEYASDAELHQACMEWVYNKMCA